MRVTWKLEKLELPMEKYLFLAAIMFVTAIAVPQLLDRQLDAEPSSNEGAPTQMARQEASGSTRSNNPLDGRKVQIPASGNGHFYVEARMNGYRTTVLVDTGATAVAINETTARRMGIRLRDFDFKYKVSTANGFTDVVRAEIDEITIGRVRVENVIASVARDEALNVVLLGMSFLQKLRKFEIANNELVLTQ